MAYRAEQDGDLLVLLLGMLILVVDLVRARGVGVELDGVWDRSMTFESQSVEAVAEILVVLRGNSRPNSRPQLDTLYEIW